MSDMFSFKIRPEMAKEIEGGPWFVRRIANIVASAESDQIWYQETKPFAWVLDSTNNWFLYPTDDPLVWIFSYRYAGGENQAFFDALKVVILWLLQVEERNG